MNETTILPVDELGPLMLVPLLASERAVGVLALAFPLHPPWRPESTRLPELTGAGVPARVASRCPRAGGDPAPPVEATVDRLELTTDFCRGLGLEVPSILVCGSTPHEEQNASLGAAKTSAACRRCSPRGQ